jgi:hypothetical protein
MRSRPRTAVRPRHGLVPARRRSVVPALRAVRRRLRSLPIRLRQRPRRSPPLSVRYFGIYRIRTERTDTEILGTDIFWNGSVPSCL